MGIRLVQGQASYDVTLLNDVAIDWEVIKVAAANGQAMNIPSGTAVELQADDSAVAGDYIVTRALGPASPRGWRLFLKSTSDAGAAGSVGAPTAKAPTGGDNTKKMYAIHATKLGGANVRRSVMTYTVPYSRLSAEYARLTRSGAKILSISEV